MTDPQKAKQFSAEHAAIREPDWGSPAWKADLDRYCAELEDFFRSAERQQWYEEVYGPYRLLFHMPLSPGKAKEAAKPTGGFAREFAENLRRLPPARFKALLMELAADFGRAVAEESEELSWEA